MKSKHHQFGVEIRNKQIYCFQCQLDVTKQFTKDKANKCMNIITKAIKNTKLEHKSSRHTHSQSSSSNSNQPIETSMNNVFQPPSSAPCTNSICSSVPIIHGLSNLGNTCKYNYKQHIIQLQLFNSYIFDSILNIYQPCIRLQP
jgi:hypothetical protein